MPDEKNSEIRLKLDDLEKRGLCMPEPPSYFDDIKNDLPESIEIIERSSGRLWQYNCFAFALGLHTHPNFYKTGKDGYIYSSFVKKLLSENELIKTANQNNPQNNDIAVYRNAEGELKHAGIVSENKIISKWSNGPILKHRTWGVPTRYGNQVIFYESVSQKKIYQLYEQYKSFNIKT